ncbi:MAG TPA: beta-ketoacyl synthase N-terminal-like domain-containing protein, partial [Polyangiaceae bacterium]|nr:beta-ketoacyl synthase N-terminal-like domain-containing protein [Polyangiaceae bacterium]
MNSTLPASAAPEVEQWLCSRLASALDLELEAVRSAVSFSALGLDSMAISKLARELSARFGIRVSVSVLFAHPSVLELTRALTGLTRALPGQGSAALQPEESRLGRTGEVHEKIAVVSLACRFPGAPDPESFWRLLLEGRHAIVELPEGRFSRGVVDSDPRKPGKTHVAHGGFLNRVDAFDPLFFGISPREARQMDPQQRLMLEVCWEALERAGLRPSSLRESRTGVFLGAIWADYARLAGARLEGLELHSATGQALNLIANRISYAFGLRGPSLVVDTACSSSLVALHLAARAIRSGECDAALAGGVNLILSEANLVALAKFGGLTTDARCKAFDARADGFVRGEGAGVVMLKRASLALRDGDPVLCFIAGSAVNNDGPSNGLTAPNPRAQVEVLRAACEDAGLDPARVGYVEAHGTGTELGDPIEASAIGEVYGRSERSRPVRVGSVKTNIGHLEGAAGIAGFAKAVLAVSQRVLPASLHFEQPNPHIPFDELGVQVQIRTEPWVNEGGPRYAAVSSFGWGGTNCHVILQQNLTAPEDELAGENRPLEHSSADRAPAVSSLEAEAAGASDVAESVNDWVFVCSPQGGQWARMGQSLLRDVPAFRARAQRFDEAYRKVSGQSLLTALASGRAGSPRARVDVLQPLIVLVQLGLAAAFEAAGIEPSAVIGHSLGEVSAARLAGGLDDDDTALLLHHYSRLQATTDGEGTMATVATDMGGLAPLLEHYGPDLTWAGSNSASSSLLSGKRAAVADAIARLEEQGIFARPIAVNVAAHSAAMDPILAELHAKIASIRARALAVPMFSSLTTEWVSSGELDASYWPKNLRLPVRFGQAFEKL